MWKCAWVLQSRPGGAAPGPCRPKCFARHQTRDGSGSSAKSLVQKIALVEAARSHEQCAVFLRPPKFPPAPKSPAPWDIRGHPSKPPHRAPRHRVPAPGPGVELALGERTPARGESPAHFEIRVAPVTTSPEVPRIKNPPPRFARREHPAFLPLISTQPPRAVLGTDLALARAAVLGGSRRAWHCQLSHKPLAILPAPRWLGISLRTRQGRGGVGTARPADRREVSLCGAGGAGPLCGVAGLRWLTKGQRRINGVTAPQRQELWMGGPDGIGGPMGCAKLAMRSHWHDLSGARRTNRCRLAASVPGSVSDRYPVRNAGAGDKSAHRTAGSARRRKSVGNIRRRGAPGAFGAPCWRRG